MARKSKKTETHDDALAAKVSRLCSMGEARRAAELVRDSAPSEADFDIIMAAHPGLREAYFRL